MAISWRFVTLKLKKIINKVNKISSCVLFTSRHLKKKCKKILEKILKMKTNKKKVKKKNYKFTGLQLRGVKSKIHSGSLVHFGLVSTPPHKILVTGLVSI